MRILITTFTFHPEGNGVAEVAAVQAFGFAQRGHEVTVATFPVPERKTVNYPAGVEVREFDVQGSTKPNVFKGQADEYRDFIATFPCDVIIMHCWHTWPTDAAMPVLSRNPAKKILVSHGYGLLNWMRRPKFPWGLPSFLKAQRYTFRLPGIIRQFDHVVFLSNRVDWTRFFDRRMMDWCGFKNWSVIPNGAAAPTPLESADVFRRSHGLENTLLFLNVANYCDRKNQLSTLRSYAAANPPGSTLVFIGSEINDYAIELKKLRDQLQTANPSLKVLILEKVPKNAIAAAYQACDVFLLSAKAETQPLVLLDIMACGKPFLSTDTGCVAELPGGVIVRSESEMSRAILKLAANPPLRIQLGSEGRTGAEQDYNWTAVMEKYDQLIHRLAGKSSLAQTS